MKTTGGAQKRSKPGAKVQPIDIDSVAAALEAKPKRTTVKKSVRFEVFKRDLYTCRYCGGTPPDCMLVIDHIIPVSKGGTNDISNLVTSCSVCNTGKGARELDATVPPSDSFQRARNIAQERMELEYAHTEFVAYESALASAAETLTVIASQRSGRQWNLPLTFAFGMLRSHDFSLVAESVSIAASKIGDGLVDRYEGVKYAWGIIKNKEAGNG